MKPEESMAGEDSKPEGTCSELAGTHFTIGKIKFNENSKVQKIRNQNNCGMPLDSKWISQPSFLNLRQSRVLCMVYAPPCFLHRLQFFSKQTFLGTLAVKSVPGRFFPFLPLWENFLEDSGLPFL
jgi:hypothetical protein